MAPSSTHDTDLTTIDQRVVLRNMPWSHYEVLLALRGESAVPRITYRNGEIELMAPSEGRESTKKTLARLVEAYADEIGVDLWAYGSWTLKDSQKASGAEPDECYVLGGPQRKGIPDLAIEVAWTHGGVEKIPIYEELGVPEVWFWEKGRIEVRLLAANKDVGAARSALFPDLDLTLVARLATHPNPSEAVRELRATVRKTRRAP